MKKALKLAVIAMITIVTGCATPSADGVVTAKVKSVEQVPNYTYLLVKAKGPAYWIAIPSTDIVEGSIISYRGGALMEDFYSKELDRTFDKVLFVDALEGDAPSPMEMMAGSSQGSNLNVEKLEIELEPGEGVVPISDLYAHPSDYEGKTIRVTGVVAKFNGGIMERNWIHLQDGTDFEGNYDLTVTSQESFGVGQEITVEGILALNRDFGYGYSYKILLEEAKAIRYE
jgi:hypothetical protein